MLPFPPSAHLLPRYSPPLPTLSVTATAVAVAVAAATAVAAAAAAVAANTAPLYCPLISPRARPSHPARPYPTVPHVRTSSSSPLATAIPSRSTLSFVLPYAPICKSLPDNATVRQKSPQSPRDSHGDRRSCHSCVEILDRLFFPSLHPLHQRVNSTR